MRGRLSVIVVGLSLAPATGAVSYDNLTGNPGRLFFISEDEMADDLTLAPGSALALDHIEVVARRAGSTSYVGLATMRVYADGGAEPGALLATRVLNVEFAENGPFVLDFDFAGVALPSSRLWVGVGFSLQGGQTRAGFMMSGSPSVGTSTDALARHFPDQTWGLSFVPDSGILYRVHTVPGGGVAGVLGAGLLWASRRRRARLA